LARFWTGAGQKDDKSSEGDDDVPADDDDGQPKRDAVGITQFGQAEDDKASGDHEFIGCRVEEGSEAGFLMPILAVRPSKTSVTPAARIIRKAPRAFF